MFNRGLPVIGNFPEHSCLLVSLLQCRFLFAQLRHQVSLGNSPTIILGGNQKHLCLPVLFTGRHHPCLDCFTHPNLLTKLYHKV